MEGNQKSLVSTGKANDRLKNPKNPPYQPYKNAIHPISDKRIELSYDHGQSVNEFFEIGPLFSIL